MHEKEAKEQLLRARVSDLEARVSDTEARYAAELRAEQLSGLSPGLRSVA